MQNEALVRALDVCIQQMQSGRKLEQTLELYPQWSADLTPALETIQVLRVYVDSFQISPAIAVSGHESFIESAQKIRQEPVQNASRRSWSIWLAWLVIILVALFAAFWGISAASSTFPNKLIFPIKEGWRQTRLMITLDAQQRLNLESATDQARLNDAKDLVELGQQTSVNFPGLLVQKQPDAWIVGGIPAQVSPQTEVVGNVQEGIWVEVKGELRPDGIVAVSQIRPREYVFTGTLQDVSPEALVVSGITVKLGKDTLVHGSPMAGSRVKIIAIRTLEDNWLARLVDTAEVE
jgi:hypothetical protein